MQNNSTMVKRLWILLLLLSIGFSSIWLLPEQGAIIPSCLSKDLPESLGEWASVKRVASKIEKQVLADDTQFARRIYYNPEQPQGINVEVSVVFSGKDINNSLHRPEVCLRAQGWNFTRERSIVIPSILPDGSDLPVREIVCVHPQQSETGEQLFDKDGQPLSIKRIQYYTFFGAHNIVSGHYDRTFEDIKGRLFGGYDQQWAYATFSVGVPLGGSAQEDAENEEQSSLFLQGFMKNFLPQVLEENL